jgi:hypothetical protein
LLTLDESTLFYFSARGINNNNKGLSGIIKNWSATITNCAPLSKASSQASSNRRISSAAQVLSTRLTTKSMLSDSVAISTNQKHNPQTSHSLDDVSPDITSNHLGGLSDEDNMENDEREAALSSPIKGKGRVTSSVSSILSSYYYRLNTDY